MGIMFVVILTLLEVIKFLISKREKPNGCGGLTQKERDAVFGTYRVLKESVVANQKEMLDIARKDKLTLALMLKSLENIEKKSIAPKKR